MPSTYAHYRFSRDALAKLAQDIRDIIEGNSKDCPIVKAAGKHSSFAPF